MTKITVQNPTRPSLLLSPDGSRDRNGPVEPTLTGGVRVVPSDRNEWVITEATTNLFPNPSATVNSDWLYPSRGTLDRVEVPIGHSGYGFRYIRDDTAGSGYLLTNEGSAWGSYRYAIPTGSPITISMWMRNPNRQVEFRAFFRDSSGATLPTQNQYVSASTEWQKVELTYVTDPTAAGISFYFILNNSVEGDLVELTDIQLEAKAYATPLAVGDMGAGHEWTGTPHASASTREYRKVVVGKQINAWQVAEATTNLFPNPSAVINTASVHASQATVSRRTDDGVSTETSFELTRNTDTGTLYFHTGTNVYRPITVGQAFTWSMWAKYTAGRTLTLRAYMRGATTGITNVKQESFTATGDWQYVSVAVSPGDYAGTDLNETLFYLILAEPDGAAIGTKAQITDIQLEVKANPTPLARGDMPGHTWGGTPHASASTRPNSYVTYGWLPKPDAGSIIMRAANLSVPIDSINPYLFSSGSPSAGHIFLAVNINPDTGQLRRGVYIDGVNLTTPYTWSPPMIEGEMTTVALAWADGIVKFYVDGNLIDETDLSAYTWPETTSGISLGRYSGFVSNLAVESALTFDTALTDAEISRLSAMDEAWTWRNASLTERMLDAEIEVAVPKGKSGLYNIETKVHQSDIFGAVGREVPVTNAKITSDIDRAGSKTRVDLETVYLNPENQYTIGPGRWVTVFQEISREGMGTERVQRGVFELGQPTVRIKGQRDSVSNSGSDVVDRLARASVLDTFYTPLYGNIMSDVEVAIRMLGITSMGPNILPNGSFEDEGSGWVTAFGQGAVGSVLYQDSLSVGIPDGKRIASIQLTSATAAGGYGLIRTTDVPLPSGAKRLLATALHWVNTDTRAYISMRYQDASGNILSSHTSGQSGVPSRRGWNRVAVSGDVPEGATHVRLWVFMYDFIGGRANHGQFDDIQIRPITGDLLPESVLALPPSSTRSSSRIQHLPGDTLLSAVNDRLAAIGMMAVHATPDGKFTSRPGRDVAKDAPVRTFHMDKDMQMIGAVTMERSVTSMYNRVFAIREDFTTGEAMVAVAENDDPSDQWSVHNILLEPKIVQVQDAANMEVLQEIADTELARASVQLSIKFAILPDPALTVYDIIEIAGPSQRGAVGKWAIESIESGLTTDNPLMIIGARRSTR